MKAKLVAACLAGAALAAPALAQQSVPVAGAPSMEAAPRLVVAISIDQFSADLFAEYRNRFSGGFARLLDGGVFPSGYQSHALTETCPGHSTLMTGMRPEHTGIIANNWIDPKTKTADKKIYCVEDESVAGSTHTNYAVSDAHLLVPTLGERMKAANPASRNVSVSGKDRAAVMMGGHDVDQIWWWGGKEFVSYKGARRRRSSPRRTRRSPPRSPRRNRRSICPISACRALGRLRSSRGWRSATGGSRAPRVMLPRSNTRPSSTARRWHWRPGWCSR